MLANKSRAVSKQLSAGYSQQQIYLLDEQTHLKQLVKLDPFPKDPGQNR